MEKIFAAKTQSGYVNALRKFANLPRLRREGAGRIPINQLDVSEAEKAASQVADSLESAKSLNARLAILLQYRELNFSKLANKTGVSRTAVQTWCSGSCNPSHSNIEKLCAALDIPVSYLTDGDERLLRHDDVIGLRFGESAQPYRNSLKEILDGVATGPIDKQLTQHISSLTRKAGGYFDYENGRCRFIPWRKLKRYSRPSKWPQEVEEIIDMAIASHTSIYQAHKAIEAICEEKGLPFPSKIALYKRLQRV